MTHRDHPSAPVVAVGAVILHEGRALLVRRAQPPNKDQWAIPGGRVRLGETLQRAAEREIYEETGVRVCAGSHIHIGEIIEQDDDGRVRYHYVIVDLIARYLGGTPRPGDDASAAAWLTLAEINQMPVNETSLRLIRSMLQERQKSG